METSIPHALTDARSVLAAVDTDKSALSLSLRVPQNGVSHCHGRTNSVQNDVAISDSTQKGSLRTDCQSFRLLSVLLVFTEHTQHARQPLPMLHVLSQCCPHYVEGT